MCWGQNRDTSAFWHRHIIDAIQAMLAWERSVAFICISRERNSVADALAKFASQMHAPPRILEGSTFACDSNVVHGCSRIVCFAFFPASICSFCQKKNQIKNM